MISSLKMNREQLLKHRKSHKELSQSYTLQKRKELKFKEFNQGEMKDFKARLMAERKKRDRNMLIFILSLVVLGTIMVSVMFL